MREFAIDLLAVVAVVFVIVSDPRNWHSGYFRLWLLDDDE